MAALFAAGANATPLAQANVGGAAVDWSVLAPYEKAVLTVSVPDGTVIRSEFAAGTMPTFTAFDKGGELRPAGSYNWELRLQPTVAADVQRRLAEARARGDERLARRIQRAHGLDKALVQSGSFLLVGGAFVANDRVESPAQAAAPAKGLTPTTAGDQVIPDDLIVQQSLCVGFDCLNNESFGFDTIRLKENNLRIKFEDTSTGTFPTNDWQLTANDSASGGASKFSIEDLTAAKVPFTITAGASTYSIFVDSTGRVGFRTSTPVLDLHIATSNTPAIRLEQNNSGGFTAQTWDIGANEANFFVRDVTGGSKLSFRIRPGAPTSSVDISADGDVGIITASPSQKMEIEKDQNANTIALCENTNTGAEANCIWRSGSDTTNMNLIAHGSGRVTPRYGVSLASRGEILHTGGSGILIGTLEADDVIIGTNNINRVQVNGSTGAVTISGNLTVNGTFSNPSSRELKEGFVRVDPNAVLEKFAQVPIQEWTYKNDERKLRHVGPTVEDFRDAFGLGTDGKYMFPIDVQGVLEVVPVAIEVRRRAVRLGQPAPVRPAPGRIRQRNVAQQSISVGADWNSEPGGRADRSGVAGEWRSLRDHPRRRRFDHGVGMAHPRLAGWRRPGGPGHPADTQLWPARGNAVRAGRSARRLLQWQHTRSLAGVQANRTRVPQRDQVRLVYCSARLRCQSHAIRWGTVFVSCRRTMLAACSAIVGSNLKSLNRLTTEA